jgi:hypothetical protein
MKTGNDVGDWIRLTEDRVYWWAFACLVMNTFDMDMSYTRVLHSKVAYL